MSDPENIFNTAFYIQTIPSPPWKASYDKISLLEHERDALFVEFGIKEKRESEC